MVIEWIIWVLLIISSKLKEFSFYFFSKCGSTFKMHILDSYSCFGISKIKQKKKNKTKQSLLFPFFLFL